ncbi:helix-turn-helix domain-containing protein, partial [Streptomyces spectabilis]|uniref:helix-turn-helix domain-containing protein n=1 Tax=Streptomyces spectabilis TaxID=68270 RepID=UPI0033CE47B2
MPARGRGTSKRGVPRQELRRDTGKEPRPDGEAPPEDQGAPLTQGRGVLVGAFALLEALRRRGGEAGLTELALACALPKGRAHRLRDQLGQLGAGEDR